MPLLTDEKGEAAQLQIQPHKLRIFKEQTFRREAINAGILIMFDADGPLSGQVFHLDLDNPDVDDIGSIYRFPHDLLQVRHLMYHLCTGAQGTVQSGRGKS